MRKNLRYVVHEHAMQFVGRAHQFPSTRPESSLPLNNFCRQKPLNFMKIVPAAPILIQRVIRFWNAERVRGQKRGL